MTREHTSLMMEWRIFMIFHTSYSRATAEVVCAIQGSYRTSGLEPLSGTVDPRYLKAVTVLKSVPKPPTMA